MSACSAARNISAILAPLMRVTASALPTSAHMRRIPTPYRRASPASLTDRPAPHRCDDASRCVSPFDAARSRAPPRRRVAICQSLKPRPAPSSQRLFNGGPGLLSLRGCAIGGNSRTMRILFIGDVVGAAGLAALSSFLPPLLSRWSIDLTIVNGENSADTGFGITRNTYKAIREAGADVVTLGNHSWNRKKALELVREDSRLIRPVNYVPGTPGAGLVGTRPP